MAKKDDFLSKAELAAARKVTQRSRGSHDLPASATSVDKAKYELCKQMILYMRKHGISQRELARKLAVSEPRVSEIVHYNIRKITIDKLVELHERLDRSVKVKVDLRYANPPGGLNLENPLELSLLLAESGTLTLTEFHAKDAVLKLFGTPAKSNIPTRPAP